VTQVVGETLRGHMSPLRGRRTHASCLLGRLGWCWDGQSECEAGGGPTCYKVNWAREFRYDGARARYMNRKLSTTDLKVEAAGGSTV